MRTSEWAEPTVTRSSAKRIATTACGHYLREVPRLEALRQRPSGHVRTLASFRKTAFRENTRSVGFVLQIGREITLQHGSPESARRLRASGGARAECRRPETVWGVRAWLRFAKRDIETVRTPKLPSSPATKVAATNGTKSASAD